VRCRAYGPGSVDFFGWRTSPLMQEAEETTPTEMVLSWALFCCGIWIEV